jgi:hypothetical protein
MVPAPIHLQSWLGFRATTVTKFPCPLSHRRTVVPSSSSHRSALPLKILILAADPVCIVFPECTDDGSYWVPRPRASSLTLNVILNLHALSSISDDNRSIIAVMLEKMTSRMTQLMMGSPILDLAHVPPILCGPDPPSPPA